jgi:hypothetical protein
MEENGNNQKVQLQYSGKNYPNRENIQCHSKQTFKFA